MKKNSQVEKADFFIASNSCEAGGCREHRNICVTNFKKAWKFAKNTDPYCVFNYGWNMFVWQFKIRNDKMTLVKTFDLNNYIDGIFDEEGELIDEWEFENEENFKVKYNRPKKIILKFPLEEDVIVKCKLPGVDKAWKFKVNFGYNWEDSAELSIM